VVAQQVPDCLLERTGAVAGDDSDGQRPAPLLQPEERIRSSECLADAQAVKIKGWLTRVGRPHAGSLAAMGD
jgi:hypothetical protein